MKLAVPDLISNSYFPAVAAAELGFFKDEGLDVAVELIFPVDNAIRGAARRRGRFRRRLGAFGAGRVPGVGGRQAALRAGAGDVLVSRHARRSRRAARRRRRGVKGRASARRRGSRWACAGCSIEAGIDPVRDEVTIAPVPGAAARACQFRPHRREGARGAARSTASGPTAWAPRSRCAAAPALSCSTSGAATDPKRCFNYTMASLAATDRLIARSPEIAAAAVRAIVKTQAALKGGSCRWRPRSAASCSRPPRRS